MDKKNLGSALRGTSTCLEQYPWISNHIDTAGVSVSVENVGLEFLQGVSHTERLILVGKNKKALGVVGERIQLTPSNWWKFWDRKPKMTSTRFPQSITQAVEAMGIDEKIGFILSVRLAPDNTKVEHVTVFPLGEASYSEVLSRQGRKLDKKAALVEQDKGVWDVIERKPTRVRLDPRFAAK